MREEGEGNGLDLKSLSSRSESVPSLIASCRISSLSSKLVSSVRPAPYQQSGELTHLLKHPERLLVLFIIYAIDVPSE